MSVQSWPTKVSPLAMQVYAAPSQPHLNRGYKCLISPNDYKTLPGSVVTNINGILQQRTFPKEFHLMHRRKAHTILTGAIRALIE